MFLLALMTILALAGELNAHIIAVIVFVVSMFLWLVGGIYWSRNADGSWNFGGLSGSLVAWIAVATLAYLTLG